MRLTQPTTSAGPAWNSPKTIDIEDNYVDTTVRPDVSIIRGFCARSARTISNNVNPKGTLNSAPMNASQSTPSGDVLYE
jgi:hypothetical protein